MTLLTIEQLDVWRGRHAVIRNLNLDVAGGEIIAVIGANGAGKSSLLRTLTGFLEPGHGLVRLHGRDLAGLSPRQRVRLGIGLCPEGRRLFPGLTVEETLAVAFRGGRTARRVRIEQMLETFPALSEKRHSRAWTLSGGQQQMLAIARAMMTPPKLMLLDEPTLGLAPMIVADVVDTIRTMQQAGIGVLLAEQNIDAALTVADRIMILVRGRTVYRGVAGELDPASAATLALTGSPDLQDQEPAVATVLRSDPES